MSHIKPLMRHFFVHEVHGRDDQNNPRIVHFLISAIGPCVQKASRDITVALLESLPDDWLPTVGRYLSTTTTDVCELLSGAVNIAGFPNAVGTAAGAKLSDTPLAKILAERGCSCLPEGQYLPGARLDEVGAVSMTDILGRTDPQQMPEWAWVKAQAVSDQSCARTNRVSWVFFIKVPDTCMDVPPALEPIILEAHSSGLKYLGFFHNF